MGESSVGGASVDGSSVDGSSVDESANGPTTHATIIDSFANVENIKTNSLDSRENKLFGSLQISNSAEIIDIPCEGSFNHSPETNNTETDQSPALYKSETDQSPRVNKIEEEDKNNDWLTLGVDPRGASNTSDSETLIGCQETRGGHNFMQSRDNQVN